VANNYSFNSGIPASNNSPSVDQPDMLTNNVSAAAIWETDHVGFGEDGGGLHNQVTFRVNQAAPSLTADGVSGLYANLDSGLSQLFFQNSAGSTQLTKLPLVGSATNGAIVTPWGLKMCFGTATTSGSYPYSVTITYPSALSTLYSYQVTKKTVSINDNASVLVKAVSTTAITIETVIASQQVSWFILGAS